MQAPQGVPTKQKIGFQASRFVIGAAVLASGVGSMVYLSSKGGCSRAPGFPSDAPCNPRWEAPGWTKAVSWAFAGGLAVTGGVMMGTSFHARSPGWRGPSIEIPIGNPQAEKRSTVVVGIGVTRAGAAYRLTW